MLNSFCAALVILAFPSYWTIEIRGQMSAAMKMSNLLCSSPEEVGSDTAPPSALSAVAEPLQTQALGCSQSSTETKTPKFTLVPDNKRKRPYKMSTAQRRQRHENEVYESRVYNVTLDNNDLRQQIQQLLACRDLHITRLLLNGQRFESDVLKLVWKLLDGLRSGAFGLSPSARGFFHSRAHISQHDPEASGGVHQFVMQRGRPPFSQRAFTIKFIRVLAMVDNSTPGEDAREIRRVCGSGGGCVVEVLASLSGRITRDTLVALFPHVLSDEALVSRIIGQRITFSCRLLLYFDDQPRLVQQVVQADLVAALNALHLGESSDFAALEDVTDQHE